MTKSSIFNAVFYGRTDNTFFQLIRYTFAGGIAFGVDFLSLFLLTEFLGVYYLVSAGIAFILGLTLNYTISIRWVFSKRRLDNKKLEFMVYMFIGLAGLGLNELFIWFFTEILVIYYLLSKVFTTFFVYLWNFSARKWILFNI